MDIEIIKRELVGLQQRYFKEKAEQDEKIKGLDKQVLMILGLANEVKELKDARLRQINLNSEILEKLEKPAKEKVKESFFSRLFK